MTIAFPREDILAWTNRGASPPPFLLPGFIPTGEVALFTGYQGKSTIGQLVANAYAGGVPVFGMRLNRPPLPKDILALFGEGEERGREGPALYITAEDGAEHLHWIQQHQCAALGLTYDDLAPYLSLISVRGSLHNELATFDHRGVLSRTAACDRLEATLAEYEPELLILDNITHFFAGNENDRREVTSFINLLYSLARPYGTTVVLIGHPNKDGDSWSGSTAWRNAVRSHISLMPVERGDPSERVLRVEKANYGRPGLELRLHWHEYAFFRKEDLPPDAVQSSAKERIEDEAFLRCLAQVTEERRAVSHIPGTNYAPAVFAKMPTGKPLKADAFDRAMNRLFATGAIKANERLPFRGSNRTAKFGIAAWESAPTPLHAPPAPTRTDPTQNMEKSARSYPPIGKPITGAALAAAAPLGAEAGQ